MANIKAGELRIGNWVYDGFQHFQITASDILIIADKHNGLFIQPIPLTEEWLVRFGFEKNKEGVFKVFDKSDAPILFNNDLNGWTCDGINFSINCTQYVHQLQNLIFALTGEELTLQTNDNS